MTVEQIEETIVYESPVPLFGSGAQAARHGLREVDTQGEPARRAGAKVVNRRARKAAPKAAPP